MAAVAADDGGGRGEQDHLTRVLGQLIHLWAAAPPRDDHADAQARAPTAFGAPWLKREDAEGEDGGDGGPGQAVGRPLSDPDARPRVSNGEGTTRIALGAVVFAPYRRKVGASSPPSLLAAATVECHYGLAEVTGVQSSAGTVTVAFFGADPGVDDEAVSCFDLIPCPPGWLPRMMPPLWGSDDDGPATPQSAAAAAATAAAANQAGGGRWHTGASPCGLLERVMGWPAHAGPLSAGEALAILKEPGQRQDGLSSLSCLGDCQQRSRVSGAGEETLREREEEEGEARRCSLPPTMATVREERPLLPSLSFSFGEGAMTGDGVGGGASLHAFFAHSFSHVDGSVQQRYERRWHAAPARCCRPAVVLCVFDRYDLLRRFEIFMSMRGHTVVLLDGEEPAPRGSHGNDEDDEDVDNDRGGEDFGGSVSGRLVGVRPPCAREAFGSVCKVWLCMLRDDAQTLRGVEKLLRGVLPSSSLTAREGKGCRVDHLVTFHSEGEDGAGEEEEGESRRESALAEHHVRQFLQHHPPGHAGARTSSRHRVDADEANADEEETCFHLSVAYQHLPPAEDEPPATSVQPPQTTTGGGRGGNKVKVAGTVFGHRKVLVPASREQLLLMQTVRQSAAAAAAAKNGTSPSKSTPRHAKSPTEPSLMPPPSPLSAALLERIALGNFTDSAAANLFASYKRTFGVLSSVSAALAATTAAGESSGGPRKRGRDAHDGEGEGEGRGPVFARIRDLRVKFCQDGARFGEAFPVFAAVAALVRDVFATPAQRRPAGGGGGEPLPLLPRVALVCPSGNPTGNPLLMVRQFSGALRQLLAPLVVYDAGTAGDGARAVLPSVLWWRHGGLLVLHCDEAATRFSALHESAEVVIACGKTAAAWVAANTPVTPAITCFAVLSEVEVVPPAQHDEYLWVPFEPPKGHGAHSTETTDVDRLLLSSSAVAGAPEWDSEVVPKVLQQAVTLCRHLRDTPDVEGTAGQQRREWGEIGAFVRSIARHAAHATPLRLSELQVLQRR